MIVEEKYIDYVSMYLERFVRKDANLYNFRCPYCGDSEKSQSKARGYLIQKDDGYHFHCHNCNKHEKLKTFLRNIAPNLYNDYCKEAFVNRRASKKGSEDHIKLARKKAVPETNRALERLIRVSRLDPGHPCKEYVVSRLIPTHHHHRLYWCPEFKAWTNSLLPGKFDADSLQYEEGRLVLPLFDPNGVMFGYTGRSLTPKSKLRYIQIMLDESKPKIFGLDRVNLNKRFYALEGGIDSLFLPNAIASAGGNIQSEIKHLFFDKPNCVILYDNEPRNFQIVTQMEQAVRDGYRICVWPSHVREKDVNEYVINQIQARHIPTEQINGVIEGLMAEFELHTYSGLNALLKLKSWKKC